MAVLIPFSLSVAKENADPSAPLNAEYCFRSITMENGLSHTTVRQIVQDRRGFIWFGTYNGLNRFDGKSFRIDKSTLETEQLVSGFVRTHAFYSDTELWAGSESGGVTLNIVSCNVAELLEQQVKIFEPYASSYVTFTATHNDGVLEIATHNDGDKVPESMMEDIFKPFVRLASGELTSAQGSGIGLALARMLAESLSGTLSMDASQKDNCFVLSLPAGNVSGEIAGEDVYPQPEVAGPVSEGPVLSQRRFTVLVVEDNAQMLSMIARQMEEHYKVYTARNGNEALDVIAQHTVNVVVSDVMMAGMDGMELCSAIKNSLDYSHIPVLLLTARTDVQSKIAAMNAGADMYVDKPFSMAYLLACVGNLIKERDRLSTVMPGVLANKQDEGSMTRAEDKFVKDLKAVMEENLSNSDFNVQMLADALCMSRSSLARMMKSTFDCTVMTYIHNERMKKAALLLRTGKYRVNQVMYMTGYNTPSYFVKVFKNKYGVLPKDFMK